MKPTMLIFAVLMSATTLMPYEANAVVCARGVVRAGCAGPNGAVVVRRPIVVAPVVRPVVVAPVANCAVVNGVRVCR
jgi:hypothetical protein